MSRLRKLVLPVAIGAIAAIAIVFVAGFFVVRSDWFQNRVRQRIISEVEKATGGKVEIGRFSFDSSALRATVHSFVLHGTEPAGEPPLFHARSITVGLKIISALRRDVDVDLLAADAPELRLRIYPDGSTNFPTPGVVRDYRNPVEQFVALAASKIRIDEGTIDVNSRRIPIKVYGEHLRVRLSYEAVLARYIGALSVRQLTLGPGNLEPASFDLDTTLDIRGNRIGVTSAQLARGTSRLNLRGTLENFSALRTTFEFDGDIDLADLPDLGSLPVVRQGRVKGVGRGFVAGASAYEVSAHLTGAGLSILQRGFRAGGAGLECDFDAVPGEIRADRLKVAALGGRFSGSALLEGGTRFRIGGDVSGVSMEALGKARGMKTGGWSGSLSGPVKIEGAMESSKVRDVRAEARFAVKALTGSLPVEGMLYLAYDQRAGTLAFEQSRLSTPSTRVEFSGTLGRRLDVGIESRDLRDTLPALAMLGSARTQNLPVELKNGLAAFHGSVTGKLTNPRVSGHLSLSSFQWAGRHFDRLDADLALTPREFRADSLQVTQEGAMAKGSVLFGLKDWTLDPEGALSGTLRIAGMPAERLLNGTGKQLPVQASISGDVRLGGRAGAPLASGTILAAPLSIAGQSFDRGRAEFTYGGGVVRVISATVESQGVALRGKGAFTPAKDDWRSGTVGFEVEGREIAISAVRTLLRAPADLEGKLALNLQGEVSVAGMKPALTALRGDLTASGVSLARSEAGSLKLTASMTAFRDLQVTINGELAGAPVSGRGSWRLANGYAGQAELQFSRLTLSALAPFWRPEANGKRLPVEAAAQGVVKFSGPLTDPLNWTGRAELASVEITPWARGVKDVFTLRNSSQIVLAFDHGMVRIENARLTAKDTNLEATGAFDLRSKSSPLQFRVRGGVNMAALHGVSSDITASGVSTLDATVRGTIEKPEVYGKLDLMDVSFRLRGITNGIDKARGTILLFRDRATIEKVTAETGGGRLTLDGFVGFAGDLAFRLQATAEEVRVRYPEGFSTYLGATLQLAGSARRSLLSGKVTILRSGLSARTDIGALLSSRSKPMVTPATQNEILRGMQFDVRIQTSPDSRFETTLTRDIEAMADLRLRGTPYKPVLLGQFTVTQGEIDFLGTRYTINRGNIAFVNPVRFEPMVNLDVETRIRGIDVTIALSGPLNKLSVSYRSDPPLQPSEIIALLAVGRAPADSPTLAARQSEQDQSWQLATGSGIVGQALAAPVAGRLQRLFGVSRLKIDPKLTGVEANPEARLTIEQQVSSNITFTYITNLTQTQEQIMRLEWNINRRWSVVALRDENGLFGVDFLYRKQFR
ncbi:MAG: translocation/assembly module TamB domain-containing protein [Bryobacteraceae bacterium]